MRTKFRTAILLLSLLFALSANGEIILNPRGTLATQRILSYKNYDDIRIDRDLDGNVDEWYLRKDNTEIHVSYSDGQFSNLQFKVFKGQNVGIKEFAYKNNKLVLTKSEFRPMLIMHGEAEKDSCDPENKVLAEKVSSLNEDMAAVLSKTSNEKKSCELSEFPKFSKRLTIILRDVASNPTKFNTCVAGQSIEGVDSNLVSSRLTATMAKMRENPTATDRIFTCGFTTESEAAGKTTEDGRISFEIPKASEDPPVGLVSMFRLVYHELVHSAGVTNEDSIYQILKSCLEIPGDKQFKQNSAPATVYMAPVMKTHTEAAANNISQEAANTKINEVLEVKKSTTKRSPSSTSRAGDNSVNMKNEIAKAKAIPTADELSVTKNDKSPQGKEQAVRESVNESAPLFRAANQVMGVSNTPAMADNSESQNSKQNSEYYPSSSGGSRSSSSSGGSGNAYSGTSTYSETETGSSRSDSGGSSTGSRYQSRHGRYQSKGSSGSGGGVGSDEFIAEEVDLTKGAATKSASTRSPSRQPAGSYQSNTQAYQPTNNSDSSSSGTDETSKGRRSASAPTRTVSGDSPAIAGGGGGGSINLGSGSSGGGSGSTGGSSAASGTRNTAGRTASSSRAPASAGPVNKEQQREVMSEIVDRDHSQVRTDLKSQAFQDNLKANRVKIIDYNGNRWGDPEGQVIYLDDGSRFIRQR